MSLATRCSACGTVFRVVQDQLKVSEGWVRCGRCSEVFNAHEALFDLERDRPPHWAGTGDGGTGFDPALAGASTADLPEALAADASDPQLVDRIDAALFGPRDEPAGPDQVGTTSQAAGTAASASPARVDPALPGSSTPVGAQAGPARFSTPSDVFTPIRREPGVDLTSPPAADAALASPFDPAAEPVDDRADPVLGDSPPAPPAFLRDAERAERWKRSRARLVLALGCTVLVALLSAQVLYQFRDVLAARWPAARPAFDAACTLLDCRIDAPRRIEDMSVESTTLTRAGGVDTFRLAVTLRNHGALSLAPPSIDLTLTDSSGALVARRALAPADFRAPASPLAPGAESAWQLLLSAGTPRVSGYTVEIFYP